MTLTATGRRFLRDAAAATTVVVGLYGLSVGVQFQPVQVPGYLLVVGFDVVEELVGPFARYDLAFGAYLLCLGLAAGAVATSARRVAGEGRWGDAEGRTDDGWRIGAASALAVVGAGALLLSLWLLASTRQPTPVVITAATGAALVAGARWLVGPWPSTHPQ